MSNYLELAKASMDIVNQIFVFDKRVYFVVLFHRSLKQAEFCVHSDKHELLFKTQYQTSTFQVQPQDCIKDFCHKFKQDEVYLELVEENVITNAE